jgi:hypothetical protein
MDVVFGLWADSGAVPDHGGQAHGAFGAPVVGPLGLVDLLETKLGLGGPPVAHVVRVAKFQAVLERAGGGFWSRSLATDPWSTSRTLLDWRDQLVALGWDASQQWTAPRLADLARVSCLATDVPPGLADRVAAVLDRLESATKPPIDSLRLIDGLTVLPSNFRRLADRLSQLGTQVRAVDVSPAAPSSTALGRLQRWMIGDQPLEGTADGTVTLASCASGALAGELLGQWVAAQSSAGALIAQDGDTDLLDHGLQGSSQPRAGRSAASPLRGSLQLLLLGFKTSWRPFDPQALMELLLDEAAPLAPRASRRLASALERAPGLGGPEWRNAWTAIEEAERAQAEGDQEKLNKADERLARWRGWAEPKLADPNAGMPVADAVAICDRMASWAQRRLGTSNDPLYLATSTLANDVRSALLALNRQTLPRTLIERVIEQALDRGAANPGAYAEASPWRSTTHAGAIWQPVSNVAWWQFGQTREGGTRAPWADSERQELSAAGCPADDVALEGRAASQAWERAILNTTDCLLLVSVGLRSGDDDHQHPLAHRLAPGLDQLADRISLEQALASASIQLAGVQLPRAELPHHPLPVATPVWPVPAGFQTRRDALVESATSLEALFSCQLMWALRFVARLRPGRFRSIPDANQLLGNLAHAVAREVFPAGQPPSADTARERTMELLDTLIDELAAPLRLPELAEELTFARRRLPEAMAQLAQTLAENALTVEATETQVSGTFETILSLRGAVDLVARDANGNPVIVDLKWTRSDKSRDKELQEGRAVQLATYGALVAGSQSYRAGYFLLNQRQFAVLEGSGLIGRQIRGARSFPETWQAVVESWQLWRHSAEGGSLIAMGVTGWEDHMTSEPLIVREVRCDWCDYSTICRRRGEA